MDGNRRLWWLLCLIAVGCAPKEPAKPTVMGDSAPAFGSSEKYSDMGFFLEGMWCQAYDSVEDAEYLEYWQFSADGTFFFSKFGTKNKVFGKWRQTGKGVWLSYETFDGEPLDKTRERIQKDAEKGSTKGLIVEDTLNRTLNDLQKKVYFELAENKKDLFFTDPAVDEESQTNYAVGGGSLKRMKPPAQE